MFVHQPNPQDTRVMGLVSFLATKPESAGTRASYNLPKQQGLSGWFILQGFGSDHVQTTCFSPLQNHSSNGKQQIAWTEGRRWEWEKKSSGKWLDFFLYKYSKFNSWATTFSLLTWQAYCLANVNWFGGQLFSHRHQWDVTRAPNTSV